MIGEKRKQITVAELDRIRKRSSGPLRYYDLIRVSVREVVRKRRRYIGVLASIALGMAGFILVITMGNDLKKNFNNDLDLLGGATIVRLSFEQQPFEPEVWFHERTLDALRLIPGVIDVTNIAMKGGAAVSWHDRQFNFSLVGCQANYWSLFSFHPVAGRLIDQNDVDSGALVCVVGKDVARQVFGGDEQALGEKLSIDDNLYTVIGVLGGVRVGDRSFFVYLPMSTALPRVVGLAKSTSAYVRCGSWDAVTPVATAIPGVVKALQVGQGLRVDVSWEALKQVIRVVWWVELFIYCSIVATLVLGGFGIWNIMMATVTSRTREIGLKKAMGALDTDILYQFLFEALCVTLSSSIIGVILGRVGIEYMSRMLGSHPPEGIFLFCLLLGIVFAVVLGVGSGMYPSIRASRMQVVDAMRYE